MNSIFFCLIITLSIIIYLWCQKRSRESILITIFCSFCVVLSLCFFEIISKKYEIFDGKGELEMDATGQVGDFIGGVIGTLVAGVSIILLYRTLSAQRESSNNQANEFTKSQNESRFFELLRIHRDNVSEIEFEYVENKTKVAKSRHFFVVAHKQLEFAFTEFDKYIIHYKLSIFDIYEDAYFEDLKKNDTINKRNINNYLLLAKIDICYLVLFFGVGRNGKEEIIETLSEKYKTLFVTDIVDYYRMKPSGSSKYHKHWKILVEDDQLLNNIESILQEREDWNNSSSPGNLLPYANGKTAYYPDNYVKYYGGHRFRLGHYYRHLYQLVCFVHLNKDLSNEDKKNYTRIIRGQLSDYEQILFFYNSISQLGRVWELMNNKNEAVSESDHLISTYSLVKNIAKRPLVDNIQTRTFYP